jgi:hypothetical protein
MTRDRELDLITGLCRELAKVGLTLGMSDAKPAVVIRSGVCSPLWVTVDASGEFFEWEDAEHQHPVNDPAGAATLMSQYVKAQRSRPGEAS